MKADDIRREIEASRRAIQADYAFLRQELDFATKAKKSVRKNPVPWLGGAAFLGFLLSPRKKPRGAKRRRGEPALAEPAKKLTLLGIVLGGFRLLFPVLRPLLTNFALRKLAGVANRFPS